MPALRLSLLATIALALAAGAALLAAPCRATTVVVPDDFPTIQEAINSPTADRILVRDGHYVENLVIDRSLSLEPFPLKATDNSPLFDEYPTLVGSIEMGSGTFSGTIRGFHVTGRLNTAAHDYATISDCRVDSGVVCGRYSVLSIRGCIIRGGLVATVGYPDITNNTIVGGGIYVRADGCCPYVRGNYVVGPAAIGIRVFDAGMGGTVSDNTVVGCTKGMDIKGTFSQLITGNVVTDCEGVGIQVRSQRLGPTITGNMVQRCGGHAFLLNGASTTTGNTALDAGGCGMWVDREGEDPPYMPTTLQGNRILRSGSDGIYFDQVGEIASNVVGRSGGRGIVVLPTGTAINVHNNTSYWNSRAGLDLNSDVGGTVTNNVAYANQHEGLVWSGGGSPTLGCNDWFANVTGATSGVLPGETDLAVDPFFCNVPADDVHLAVFSPLRNTPSCGLIGALDVGCSEPTAVSNPPQRTGPEFACSPRPSTGGVRFTWRRLSEAGKVDVFDAAGARRWKGEAGKNTEGADWDAKDDSGAPVPAGVYFARIRAGSFQATTRVVVVR